MKQSADGSLAVIDGQHRIGMLKILSQKAGTAEEFDFDRILVEVYSQPKDMDADTYATQIFQEINKAQPANLVDLPGVAKDEDLEIINTAVASISEQFPEMFKASTNCRRPHLNVDNVRNELFLNRVIERHEIGTAQQMEDWMLARNKSMAEKYASGSETKVSERVLSKAKAHDFFLGLDSSWYDE